MPLRKIKEYSSLQGLDSLIFEKLHNSYLTQEQWKKVDINHLKFLGLEEEIIDEFIQELTGLTSYKSDFQKLYEEAIKLYIQGRSHDAAVLFERTQQIAKKYKMLQENFKSKVWAAITWHESYYITNAYNLLLDIVNYGDRHLDSIDRWKVKRRQFYLSIDFDPQLNKLLEHLENLRQFKEDYSDIPVADFYQDQGHFLRIKGNWRDSLKQYELSWSEYISQENYKWDKAYYAAFCNLKLGDLKNAQYWCDILENTEINLPISRWAFWTLKANIFLYGGKWQKAENSIIEAENKSQIIQIHYYQNQSLLLRVRTLLLQLEYGDILNRKHPARFRFKNFQEKSSEKLDLHTKYDRILLIVDYYLACLRYILRIPPVDDYWYQYPHQVPTIFPSNVDLSEFQKRAKLTQRAINKAMKQGKYLDDYLGCNWRQQEVQERQRRLEELSNVTK